ncbi:uncharacterized protein [Typha latifolia]|uniref:uncharacterized protein n=1 Tax=Typha latifolia TaxID=4733 RepID=UPI003C2C8F88
MRKSLTPRGFGNRSMSGGGGGVLSSSPERRRGWRVTAKSLPCSGEFAALGLTPVASRDDVKRAYRSLALKFHPDVMRGQEKEAAFKEIKSAYESLMAKFEEESQSTTEAFEDEWDEWGEWMGFEGGIPVVYNPT